MQEGDGRRDILVPFYIGGDNFKCFYAIFRSLALILGFLLILGFKRNFRPVLSRGKIALARVLTLFCMSFCCQHIYTRVRKQGDPSYGAKETNKETFFIALTQVTKKRKLLCNTI